MMKTVKILTFCLLLVACTKGVVLEGYTNTQPSYQDCISNCNNNYQQGSYKYSRCISNCMVKASVTTQLLLN